MSSLLPEYAIVGGTGASTEMIQRTLFNPTRRPAPAALEAGAGRLQRGQFALTGTLVIDGKSTAYLREVAGNKPRRVLAGDKINGMLVAEVKPDRVKLTLGDESEELVLKIASNPRPTAPPGAPVVARVPPGARRPCRRPPQPGCGAGRRPGRALPCRTAPGRESGGRGSGGNAARTAPPIPRANPLEQACAIGPPGRPTATRAMSFGDNPHPALPRQAMEMTMKNNRFPARAVAVAVTALLVAACATPPGDSPSAAAAKGAPAGAPPGPPGVSPALAEAARRTRLPNPDDDSARLYKGTGVVVKGQTPGGGAASIPRTQVAAGGGVVLNFEGADLREVIKNILGDILNENYMIDASVGGQVTIRTTSGIPRDALPATLETLLRMNGATMVKEDGIYKILPSAVAVRGNVTPQLGNSQRGLPPGFSVQIVPLRYIGTREMMRILEPLAKDATAIRPDDLRNLLVLSGTERELRHLLETIELFDVDWIAGMSVGIFTLQNADVKAVGQELDRIVGDRNTGPLAGILRVIPIERMNALLVITPQPAYLEEAKKWIARLDQGSGGDGPRFYVYNLQNQRAEKLGPLLTQAFTGRAAPATPTPPPTLAPGTPAGTIVSPPTFQAQAQTTTPTPPTIQVTTPPPQGPVAQAIARAAEGIGIVRNIQVVADKDNNTLLIVATAPEYTVIEAALKKLDVPARQVAIEVTIASVTLTDELDFGVEWLFKGGAPSGRGAGGLITRSTPFNPELRPAGQRTRGSGSRRASRTSSRTRTSPAACRRCCICSTPTATPRSSRIRTSRRSTTRRRRSRPATRSRSTSRASSAAGATRRPTSSRRRRSTSTPACCCR